MVSTAEGIKLISAETARIKEYLRGTGQEEWALESPCEGWTVGDVIGQGYIVRYLGRRRPSECAQLEVHTPVSEFLVELFYSFSCELIVFFYIFIIFK